MAEELAFEQGLGEGGAVHRHEGPGRARGEVVDHPRHQLLAGAAFTGHEHRGFALSRLADQRDQLLHRLAASDERAHRGGRLLRKHLVVRDQSLQLLSSTGDLEALVDLGAENLRGERLGDEVAGALLHRGDGGFDRAERRHHHHHAIRIVRPELLDDFDAIHSIHLQIGDHHVEGGLLVGGQPFGT